MIRITLDIRTGLTPAALYHRIADAIANGYKLEDCEIVTADAEFIDFHAPREFSVPATTAVAS